MGSFKHQKEHDSIGVGNNRSFILHQSLMPVATTLTTTSNAVFNLFTKTIPGGTLKPGDILRFSASVTNSGISGGSARTITAYLNGSVHSVAKAAANLGCTYFSTEIVIGNNSAKSFDSDDGYGYYLYTGNTPRSSSPNLAADIVFDLDVKNGISNFQQTMTVENSLIEVIRK